MDTPKDTLKKMTAWDVEPTLSEDELDELLIPSGLKDTGGRLPSDPSWTPTYDLNLAAANGWLIKAARAAATVEIDPPGSGIMTSKVFDNCRAMARIYRARVQLTIGMR